jgi:20S proteasome alpha/beta subunit
MYKKESNKLDGKHTRMKVNPMTCVIGMYCDKGNNAIIISDSRQMEGLDFSPVRKIYTIQNNVVFAASGLSGMAHELRESVERFAVERRIHESESIVKIFEDAIYQMYCHYKNPQAPRFDPNMPLLNAIIGIFVGKKPKLYCLFENGWAEPIRSNFRATGDGQRFANQILRPLYKRDLTVEQAIELGVHTITQISKVDAVVDDIPQVAILKDNQMEIVNYDSDKDDFLIPHPKLEDIKKKVNGIEEIRAKVFRLMMSNDDLLKNEFKKNIEKFKD